jgi:hypothetical protein
MPSRGLASRFFLRLLGVETILQLYGGGALQPCRERRTTAAQSRVQHSVFRPGDGGQPHRGVSQHVVRREGGTHVLGWSHSCFRGEDGSEDLPVRFGAAGARWRGVGGQVDAAAGAEVVAAGEVLVADEIVGAICAPGLQLFVFDSPSSGDVGEGLVAAASALRSSLLLFGRPERRSLSLLLEWAAASHLEVVVP